MKPIQQTSSKTKFEQDLQIYFPDLYKFTQLMNWESHYSELMAGIIQMVDENAYGKIEIVYVNGKVNYINQTRQLTANKSQRPEKIIKRALIKTVNII